MLGVMSDLPLWDELVGLRVVFARVKWGMGVEGEEWAFTRGIRKNTGQYIPFSQGDV